jgi:hypothetical protein
VAPLAKTADDLPSTGRLGKLFANLLFLRLLFVCCGLEYPSVNSRALSFLDQTLTFPPARREKVSSSPTVVVARSGPGLLPVVGVILPLPNEARYVENVPFSLPNFVHCFLSATAWSTSDFCSVRLVFLVIFRYATRYQPNRPWHHDSSSSVPSLSSLHR